MMDKKTISSTLEYSQDYSNVYFYLFFGNIKYSDFKTHLREQRNHGSDINLDPSLKFHDLNQQSYFHLNKKTCVFIHLFVLTSNKLA